jgi:hypothetical protein
MTTAEYLKALEKLGLAPYANETANALGLTRDGLAKLASGKSRVRCTLALLIRMYLRFGVPRLN